GGADELALGEGRGLTPAARVDENVRVAVWGGSEDVAIGSAGASDRVKAGDEGQVHRAVGVEVDVGRFLRGPGKADNHDVIDVGVDDVGAGDRRRGDGGGDTGGPTDRVHRETPQYESL